MLSSEKGGSGRSTYWRDVEVVEGCGKVSKLLQVSRGNHAAGPRSVCVALIVRHNDQNMRQLGGIGDLERGQEEKKEEEAGHGGGGQARAADRTMVQYSGEDVRGRASECKHVCVLT